MNGLGPKISPLYPTHENPNGQVKVGLLSIIISVIKGQLHFSRFNFVRFKKSHIIGITFLSIAIK